jgi:hypothetical protein
MSQANRKWSSMPKTVSKLGDTPRRARKVTTGSMMPTVFTRSLSVNVTLSAAGDGELMEVMLSKEDAPVKIGMNLQ